MGQSLALQSRFLIAEVEMPPASVILKSWDEFAGVESPWPTRKTALIGVAVRIHPSPKT